jgi:hypothetical protein
MQGYHFIENLLTLLLNTPTSATTATQFDYISTLVLYTMHVNLLLYAKTDWGVTLNLLVRCYLGDAH